MHDNEDTDIQTPPWQKSASKDLFTEEDYERMAIEEENARLAYEQEEYLNASRKEFATEEEERRFAHLKPGKWLSFKEIMTCELPELERAVSGFFDLGDKVAIIGPTKTKKTWLATQLAICIATGTPFLGIEIPKKRKVLMVQYEVKAQHFINRVRALSEALEVSIEDVESRLIVINAKGITQDLEILQTQIEQEGIEVVIFDPFYKMFEGDESDPETVKAILRVFDRMTTKSGCAVVYIHHDKKGSTDKTETRDRGSGTGIVSRDYDCGLIISEHQENPNAIVIDPLQRNYKSPGAIVAEWWESHFRVSDLQPVVKKAGRRLAILSSEEVTAIITEILHDGAMECSKFRELLKLKLGVSRDKVREFVFAALSAKRILEVPGVTKLGIPKKFVLADSAKRNSSIDSDSLF